MRFVRCTVIVLGTFLLVLPNSSSVFGPPRVLPKSPAPRAKAQADPKAQNGIVESYGKLPLSFEENRGQSDPRVRFLSRGQGYTLLLTGDEAVFSLSGGRTRRESPLVPREIAADPSTMKPEPAAKDAVLRMKLMNANSDAAVTGADELPGKVNYFIGNDPRKWQTNVSTYTKVRYEDVYSGVDLVYYGNQQQLEYDFVVAPGADPRRIQFEVNGAKQIRQDENGELVLQMGDGEVRWHKPVCIRRRMGSGRTSAVAT